MREYSAREAARRAGKSFLGRRAVRDQDRHAFAKSVEERFTLRPTVAARSRWVRFEKLQEDRAWLEAYAAARERLRVGDPHVRFPHGTWKLRVYYRVPCEDPPTPPTPLRSTA